MARVKQGDTVKVHYTGKLDDGTVFDTSYERQPLQFTVGQGQVIPGVEEAVVGMQPGEDKSTQVPADKAYGPHRDEWVAELDKNQLPDNLDPQPGQSLKLSLEDGRQIPVTVVGVTDDKLKVDANHPLAGETLNFELKLVEII
jgi:FKBP-type peptidyl-prolyl cis-trans isomerase 2